MDKYFTYAYRTFLLRHAKVAGKFGEIRHCAYYRLQLAQKRLLVSKGQLHLKSCLSFTAVLSKNTTDHMNRCPKMELPRRFSDQRQQTMLKKDSKAFEGAEANLQSLKILEKSCS